MCVNQHTMSLETHIAGSEDRLLDGLHFAGRSSASYVIERRSCTFPPSSASSWKPSGVRLCRFNLADQQGWLDGNSMRLVFTLTNLSGSSAIGPECDSPASMFRRLRIIANGSAIVEDIEEYGRVFQLMSELRPSQARYNDIGETWTSGSAAQTLTDPRGSESAIPADSSRQVCVTLLSPFLAQGKYLPLTMLPLTLEIELGEADDAFSGSGNSWEITRPRLIADVCQLDQALQNSYAKHLLDGKSLPIYTQGLYSLRAAVPTGNSLHSLPIARGFTRLDTVFVTFWDGTGKWINRFFCPSQPEPNIEVNDATKWNITIGAERYPQFDCESVQESFYRMRQALAAHSGNDMVSMSSHEYRINKFVLGQNLQKAPGSAHTGINARSGSQLTLNFRNLGDSTMIHVILVYEQIVNVSAAGVEVLD